MDKPSTGKLEKIAKAARVVVEEYASASSDQALQGFPRGSCGIVSELLGRYLMELGYRDVIYVCGMKSIEGSHAWVEVGGVIVDITGDQFGQPPVVVGRNTAWHAGWERDQLHEPICDPKNWMMYPSGVWKALKAGLDATLKS